MSLQTQLFENSKHRFAVFLLERVLQPPNNNNNLHFEKEKNIFIIYWANKTFK
jgi:hypothetical protein